MRSATLVSAQADTGQLSRAGRGVHQPPAHAARAVLPPRTNAQRLVLGLDGAQLADELADLGHGLGRVPFLRSHETLDPASVGPERREPQAMGVIPLRVRAVHTSYSALIRLADWLSSGPTVEKLRSRSYGQPHPWGGSRALRPPTSAGPGGTAAASNGGGLGARTVR